jgi:phosphoinositide-3-kinase regulatory subunit
MDRELKQAKSASKQVERELNSLKPRMRELEKRREDIRGQMLLKGMTVEEVNSILRDGSIEHLNMPNADPNNLTSPSALGTSSTDYMFLAPATHNDKTTWYLECNRDEAQRNLLGKADGTFLIRKSSSGGDSYALSIVAEGKVQHCLIKTARGCYGFAEPYIIHSDLESLVLHYAETSLEEHNDALRTTLKYPVFAMTPQHGM